MSCQHCGDYPLTLKNLADFIGDAGCILEVELLNKDFIVGYFDSYDKTYEILTLRSDSTNDKTRSVPIWMSNVKSIKNLCCEEIYEN